MTPVMLSFHSVNSTIHGLHISKLLAQQTWWWSRSGFTTSINLTDVADKRQWVRFTAGVKRTWCCHFTLWRQINFTRTPHAGGRWSLGGRTTLDNRLALQGINEATAVNNRAQSAQTALALFRQPSGSSWLLHIYFKPVVLRWWSLTNHIFLLIGKWRPKCVPPT